MRSFCFLIILLTLAGGVCRAQRKDSLLVMDTTKKVLDKKKVYSQARRAALMSALLPGLGQAYNRKYWKIPIIYAGLAGFAYMYSVNNKEYVYYRDNLIAITDGDPSTVNTTPYYDTQLKTLKDQYKKNRDFGMIGFFGVYLINIIDANIDGHLKTFDVSDNLGLHIEPDIRWPGLGSSASGPHYGLAFTLTFK